MRRKKIKILAVVGARPNFIKIAPLFEEFKKHKSIKRVLVHTGQHYDFEMSPVFFKELKIPKPDYNLKVGSGSHAWQTAKMMEKLEPLLLKEKPDLAIVMGDVNSTLAGALTAAKMHIPVAHIESGVRSFDMSMPEEINRRLTDQISDFLFCPTKTAVENLKKEGVKKGVYNVGDVMYDVFLKGIKIAERKSKILKKLKLRPKEYFLLTLHRPENVDKKRDLQAILETIDKSEEKIVFPVHPRTKKNIKKFKLKIDQYKNISFIKSVGHLDILVLEKNAKKILTDSGGIQKESYWLKIPCITLRDKTEWTETIQEGWNVLVDKDKEKILKAINKFEPRTSQHKYFGKGKAAQKIIKILIRSFND